jgi:hypothetical protein
MAAPDKSDKFQTSSPNSNLSTKVTTTTTTTVRTSNVAACPRDSPTMRVRRMHRPLSSFDVQSTIDTNVTVSFDHSPSSGSSNGRPSVTPTTSTNETSHEVIAVGDCDDDDIDKNEDSNNNLPDNSSSPLLLLGDATFVCDGERKRSEEKEARRTRGLIEDGEIILVTWSHRQERERVSSPLPTRERRERDCRHCHCRE